MVVAIPEKDMRELIMRFRAAEAAVAERRAALTDTLSGDDEDETLGAGRGGRRLRRP